MREQREAELRQLRKHGQALSREVERLEEEKTTLRKKLLDQAITSRKKYVVHVTDVYVLQHTLPQCVVCVCEHDERMAVSE